MEEREGYVRKNNSNKRGRNRIEGQDRLQVGGRFYYRDNGCPSKGDEL